MAEEIAIGRYSSRELHGGPPQLVTFLQGLLRSLGLALMGSVLLGHFLDTTATVCFMSRTANVTSGAY